MPDRLRWALDNLDEARNVAAALRPEMAVFDWDHTAKDYDRELEELARSLSSGDGAHSV